MKTVALLKAEELPPGSLKTVVLDGGKKVALANIDGAIYAFEDRCSHDDGELASGKIVDGCLIECPRHGARFELKTGRACRMPAVCPIEVYTVEVKNGQIWVQAE